MSDSKERQASSNEVNLNLLICVTLYFLIVPVNLIAIVILARRNCDLTECMTRYLIAMATADLIVVIVAVIMDQINNIYSFANFLLITPVCTFTNYTRLAAMDCSVWFTVAFTFDRYIAICCHNVRRRYCTERTALIVLLAVAVGSCLRCIPYFFLTEPYAIVNEVPWRCVTIPEYFTSTLWKMYELVESIVTPLLPMCLILMFNAFTVRNIIAANSVRRGLRNSSSNEKDSELENRRKSIMLLFALSANFIILWLPYLLNSMTFQTVNYYYTNKYLNTPRYIWQQFAFLSRQLSICTNTCIYGLTQRKFREELKNGAKYLFTFNGRVCK